MESLLSGELKRNDLLSGNMKRMKFYICPDCGNVIMGIAGATVICCGRKLEVIDPVKASDENKLSVEVIESDFFISSNHEMRREHYISFVALVTSDMVLLKKLYPEWDMQLRIPVVHYGRLVWYCSRHGLLYQEMR